MWQLTRRGLLTSLQEIHFANDRNMFGIVRKLNLTIIPTEFGVVITDAAAETNGRNIVNLIV